MGVKLTLTLKAENDLDCIRSYTLRRWGERQMDRYASLFDKAFVSIKQKPEIGIHRRGTPADTKSVRAGKHIVFYRFDGESIIVDRVLHERMDFSQHLD
jgi:toxin ParE1/3/4